MRVLGFDSVRVQWLGAPGLKLHEDLIATPRAVRWNQLSADEIRIPNGHGSSMAVRTGMTNGQVFLELVQGSRSHLALKQIKQATDLVSRLPAPMYIRDTRTSELILLMSCTPNQIPPQSKGTGVLPATWIFDYDKAIEGIRDINAAEV